MDEEKSEAGRFRKQQRQRIGEFWLGSFPSSTPGTFAGSRASAPDAASRGASQLLRAEVALTRGCKAAVSGASRLIRLLSKAIKILLCD